MIYGRLLTSVKAQEVTNESSEFDITSVVYDEYLNRKAMLEACTVEADKAVLEAQVNILYEVSIKDIITTIKNKIEEFLKWLKDLVLGIINKIKDFIEKKKKSKAFKILRNIGKGKRSVGESAILNEDVDDGREYGMDESFFASYHWTVKSKSTSANFGSENFASRFDAVVGLNSIENELEKENPFNKVRNGNVPENLKEEMGEFYNKLFNELQDSYEVIKSLEYTESKKYDKLYNAISSKEIFSNPDNYRSEFIELVNFLSDEGDIHLPKALEEIGDQLKELETASQMKSKELVKEIESSVENIPHDVAMIVASKTISMSKKAATLYQGVFQKIFNASNMIVARAFRISSFALANNKKLGYLPKELIDEIKAHL